MAYILASSAKSLTKLCTTGVHSFVKSWKCKVRNEKLKQEVGSQKQEVRSVKSEVGSLTEEV